MTESAFCSYFQSRSLQLSCRRNSSGWASAGSPVGIETSWTLFSSNAGVDQSQRNNVAALAIISFVMMRLIPGRRYGVLPHLRCHGEPLPCPNESEREGYVPNVIHTCGALLQGDKLIVPTR